MPAAKKDETATEDVRVVVVSVSHKRPGKNVGSHLARKGQVIALDIDEAERLRALGAVVGKDEPDPTPGRPLQRENPYGGTPLESPEDHAARVRAERP